MKQGNDKQSANDDKDLPGYPHYPANEDITETSNNNGHLSLDEEKISLPDVSDIPGQEHITPAPLGMLGDTTISSADEEDIIHGDSLDGSDEDDLEIVMGTEADVTKEDLLLLENDDVNVPAAELDDTDDDGEQLNEETGQTIRTGEDLDVPGSEDDDDNEAIGEEDEENNYYSLGSDDNDNITEGTP